MKFLTLIRCLSVVFLMCLCPAALACSTGVGGFIASVEELDAGKHKVAIGKLTDVSYGDDERIHYSFDIQTPLFGDFGKTAIVKSRPQSWFRFKYELARHLTVEFPTSRAPGFWLNQDYNGVLLPDCAIGHKALTQGALFVIIADLNNELVARFSIEPYFGTSDPWPNLLMAHLKDKTPLDEIYLTSEFEWADAFEQIGIFQCAGHRGQKPIPVLGGPKIHATTSFPRKAWQACGSRANPEQYVFAAITKTSGRLVMGRLDNGKIRLADITSIVRVRSY